MHPIAVISNESMCTPEMCVCLCCVQIHLSQMVNSAPVQGGSRAGV